MDLSKWVKTPNTCLRNQFAIVELCKKHFGPNLRTRYTPAGRKKSNHDNWTMTGGYLYFRYEKDFSWFMIMGADLLDQKPLW